MFTYKTRTTRLLSPTPAILTESCRSPLIPSWRPRWNARFPPPRALGGGHVSPDMDRPWISHVAARIRPCQPALTWKHRRSPEEAPAGRSSWWPSPRLYIPGIPSPFHSHLPARRICKIFPSALYCAKSSPVRHGQPEPSQHQPSCFYPSRTCFCTPADVFRNAHYSYCRHIDILPAQSLKPVGNVELICTGI